MAVARFRLGHPVQLMVPVLQTSSSFECVICFINSFKSLHFTMFYTAAGLHQEVTNIDVVTARGTIVFTTAYCQCDSGQSLAVVWWGHVTRVTVSSCCVSDFRHNITVQKEDNMRHAHRFPSSPDSPPASPSFPPRLRAIACKSSFAPVQLLSVHWCLFIEVNLRTLYY